MPLAYVATSWQCRSKTLVTHKLTCQVVLLLWALFGAIAVRRAPNSCFSVRLQPVTPAAAPAKAAAAKGAVSEYGLAISTNRAEPPLNNKSVEENKAEAKKWIAAWKSRATKPKVLSLF